MVGGLRGEGGGYGDWEEGRVRGGGGSGRKKFWSSNRTTAKCLKLWVL